METTQAAAAVVASSSNCTDFFGASCSFSSPTTDIALNDNTSNNDTTDYCQSNPNNCVPSELTEVSTFSLICVFAYCLVFIVATTGNLVTFKSLWQQYKITGSRISLLLLHLHCADLIVCCTLIPTEVFWRLTIAWRGGNLLCKLTQFLRAFGLYLSSLVLICVSLDRFMAIVFPLSVIKSGAYKRVKLQLSVAWTLAAVFSIPQAVYFGTLTHPQFSSFTQCVTAQFLNQSSDVHVYSIFSVVVMYFVPLLVILSTYTAIIIKLVRKSSKSSFYSNVRAYPKRGTVKKENGRPSLTPLELRCSHNAEVNMTKAKRRTLHMTILLVSVFFFCWLPYSTMTLWYMVDWEGAEKVDPRVQDALFLMAVANSCINPWIYGVFSYYGRRKMERSTAPNYC